MRLAEVTPCAWEENYEMCSSKQEAESKVPLFLTPVPGRSSRHTSTGETLVVRAWVGSEVLHDLPGTYNTRRPRGCGLMTWENSSCICISDPILASEFENVKRGQKSVPSPLHFCWMVVG